MIRTVICEDDANTRAYLAALIQAQPYPCAVVEYASAAACLADPQAIDLLFLDIELHPFDADAGPNAGSGPSSGSNAGLDPGLNGMALARELRKRNAAPQPVIIFVTGYERYVFDAFDVGAFQYLLKPVDEAKFARVFARAVEQIQVRRALPAKVRALTLPAAHTSRTVPLNSIYYIESRNHQVTLHLLDSVFTCYAKIGELEAELLGQFFRIHKGYLVNLSYVEAYSKTEVTLTNRDRLCLSKYKYRDFVKAYLRFLKQGWAHD